MTFIVCIILLSLNKIAVAKYKYVQTLYTDAAAFYFSRKHIFRLTLSLTVNNHITSFM